MNRGFFSGYVIQKTGELLIISTLYAALSYFGSRSEHGFSWGIFSDKPIGIIHSFVGGFGVAAVFFSFTLYPIAVFLPLIFIRRFLIVAAI